MPHATLPTPALQAFILCGPGVSLTTFTSIPSELPKCLLPISNRPMVWYALDWCHRSLGVTDITLITPPESKGAIEAALATNPALAGFKGVSVLAPVDLSQTSGTGELLRLKEVHNAIKRDFVVVPCDLVSEVDGTTLLQQWMALNPLTSSTKLKGGFSVFYPTQGLEGISTKKDETDFLATVHIAPPSVPPLHGSLRPHIEQIVLSMPTDTLNDKLSDDGGFLRLRQSLLSKHSRVKMRMKHRDAHIYFFPKWVKDFTARNETFDSVSEDVVGWWAKAGWQAGLTARLGLDEVLSTDANIRRKTGSDEGREIVDAAALSSTKASGPDTLNNSAFASRVPDGPLSSSNAKAISSIPSLLAYVQPAPSSSQPQPLIRRIDTTAQLLSISLHLAKSTPHSSPLAHDHKVHPSATVEQQSRVSEADSLVAENVTLGFRSNVKESVIGANCTIGKNVRLTRCLLMDGVSVGDGVVMTGCVVGRRAKIEGTAMSEPEAGRKQKTREDSEDDKTKLTDCEIAPGFVVEAGTEAKGEKMMGDIEEDEDDEEMED